MPLQSICIINCSGNVLYSRNFNSSSKSCVNDHIFFQQIFFQQTLSNWNHPGKQTITIENIHVVYERFGDILVIVAGNHECDETILCDILDALRNLLTEVVDNNITEQSIMATEAYGKWLLAMSEFSSEDVLEWTDVDFNTKLMKLKNF